MQAACGVFDAEMHEAQPEPVPNIDEHDTGNQLCVVEYIEDIYSFYRKTEVQSCVPADYMSRQSDINEKMRAILVDWLIEVCATSLYFACVSCQRFERGGQLLIRLYSLATGSLEVQADARNSVPDNQSH
jgi:hypothetical protein